MKTKLAGMGGAPAQTFVDDVFSTYLYTGNGSTQTITNGIDLAGKGGLVWTKARDGVNQIYHFLTDTARGAPYYLSTNVTDAQAGGGSTTFLRQFNSNGFELGTNPNIISQTYASWTFRKAAKFFDVVTYTGTGANRTIAHNLGIAPGMIIVKRTDTTGNWRVYSNGMTSAEYSMYLNLTGAQASAPTVWNSTAPTSSVFSVGTDATVNASGGTYVAYLYAHDTSSTGIIQCGAFTKTSGVDVSVELGWEPQYIFVKAINVAGNNWEVYDSMRGFCAGNTGVSAFLNPNLSAAESSNSYLFGPTATGFSGYGNLTAATYIYMAIRRPNKPPTSGTQVFNAIARTGTGGAVTVTGVGFAPDFRIGTFRSAATSKYTFSKLIAPFNNLATNLTRGENIDNTVGGNFYNDGFYEAGYLSTSGHTFIDWLFKRAPGFFDVVCYTGTGSATTQAHNLGVAPEMMIVKARNTSAYDWMVYPNDATAYLKLNLTNVQSPGSTIWNNTAPTSSVFSLGTSIAVNASATTYVAYLFATLAGISKVGSYTGNGTSQNIECGFAAGARFVLIKRTDSTGDWFVWDTARGIVSANDPHLSLNTTAAEVTTDDSVDPYSAGFAVNQVAATNINVSSATYVYLSIA